MSVGQQQCARWGSRGASEARCASRYTYSLSVGSGKEIAYHSRLSQFVGIEGDASPVSASVPSSELVMLPASFVRFGS